ncbi:MAG: hypothetical protein PVJ30_09545 [Thiohalocapsa sp.]|jgi:hypothetical protein
MATQQGQHRDGGSRAKQGGEQLVDLGVGGRAVIAGHLDADGCGDQGVLQLAQALAQRPGHGDTVGAQVPGKGDAERRRSAVRAIVSSQTTGQSDARLTDPDRWGILRLKCTIALW